MLEANEGLENIFENAVKEAEKRRHEYVTIEHVLLALIKDQSIGTVLHDFKINVGALIKDVEDYLDTKCNDMLDKAKKEIEAEKAKALKEIKSVVVDLSVETASKIIRKNLDSNDNRKIAEDTVNSIN